MVKSYTAISHRTGVSTFAIRTNQRTDQKLQKSFHLTAPRKNFKIFFPTLQKKIKNATHNRQDNDSETQYLKWFVKKVDKNHWL
jgi:hypothetical protein